VAAINGVGGGMTVSVKDSSAPAQQRTAAVASDGSYSVDVTGLEAPFLIKAEWTDGAITSRLYSSSEKAGTANVNELTDLAFSRASGTREPDDNYEKSDTEERSRTSRKITAVLTELRTVLAPLFDLYGITIPLTDRSGLRALLRDVRFSLGNGLLTVTNRATGGVIFSGPIDNLSSGTFHPENLPGGVTPPPPATDGAALYGANCASCHGPLASSSAKGASASDIQGAIDANRGGMGSLGSLTPAQLASIAGALSGSTPPPPAPAPAPATCTAFTYNAFGACQSNNTQTRSVASATPAGCTGGNPALTQACTFVPPSDGAALYTQYCNRCHGSGRKGSPASRIQGAINSDLGGMGSLSFLTPAQIAAIAAAP